MAMVLNAFVEIFVKRLADLAEEEIVRLLKVKKDLVELKNTILEIKVVLVDAESKKISEESIKSWLANLREIMYDADDLLEDCRVQAEKNHLASQATSSSQPQSPSSLSQSPSSFSRRYRFVPECLSCLISVPFRHDIGKRIQKINSTLQNLQSKIPSLKLVADLPDSNPTLHNFVTDQSSWRQTTPVLVEPEIVGIDDDAKSLVDMLTGGVSLKWTCSIYAITGMAGIGKTTLAKKVYNDSRSTTPFDIVTWICVSKTYDGVELLKEMLRSIPHEENKDAETKSELCSKIRKLVKNKKFFLVLDDIWNEDVWENLFREPLHDASNGSKVLITTRQKRTAMGMGATYIHQVKEMTDEEGWSMLCKVVFRDAEGEKEIKKYQKIGMEIVQKCKGLPLAIKAVAAVLKRKDRNLRAWENVCSSQSWASTGLPEDIKPGLLLCYDDLPYYLKQCFIYSSLFPEDFTFHRPILVQMWIAEGFINETMKPPVSMEDLGDEWYNELVMRNLLQEVPVYFDKLGCKMHDLFRLLAHSLKCTSMKPRYLSLVKNEVDIVPNIDEKYRSLRTLLLSKNPSLTMIQSEHFDKLRRLRVLDISYTGVRLLPDSLGNMVQLRFLSVAFTKIKSIPDSIIKLKNLETLKANGSKYLHWLPEGVIQLKKLRHLTVGGADIQLDCMPLGMGNLKKLRTLTGFVANGDNPREESNLKDLRSLSDLTDLSMYKLENVASKEDSEEAKLGEKTCLRYLKLSCSRRSKARRLDYEEIKRFEDVFDGFNPPGTLEKLHIEGFSGHILPSFVTRCTLHNLTWLRFQDCRLVKALPPMGKLQELTILQIWGATSVSRIEPEFFGGPDGFPKLQELYLRAMLKLDSISMLEQGAMSCLKKLHIEKCPKLKSLPIGLNHIKSLTQLVIEGCENLKTIENLNSVTEVDLKSNSMLITISNLPALSIMKIRKCSSLRNVVDVNKLSNLILSDDKMEVLPQWLVNIRLKKLDVLGNTRLVSRMCDGCADWSIVKNILHVEAMSHDGLSCISYRKKDPFYQSNITNNIGASTSSVTLNASNSNTDDE